MKRTYQRLDIEPFGAHLLRSGDLDPIYIALVKMNLGSAQLSRWLIAYWCFYSAAVASFMSEKEGMDFWAWMHLAARNDVVSPVGERWPRGHERRHFRAAIATKGIEGLRDRYGAHPEGMVDYIVNGADRVNRPLKEVMQRVQDHWAFGPWIGFKIGDMLERVLRVPVSFDEATVFIFKDPEEAAVRLYRLRMKVPESVTLTKEGRNKAVSLSVKHLTNHFRFAEAPPHGDRPVGLQEVETILCKWKSHMNGHYPLNNDIDEINDGLNHWTVGCLTARAFRNAMPQPLLEGVTS